jgi:hypothetical protein
MAVTKQYVNSMSTGITMVSPPTLGQAYYDTNTGQTMIYTGGGGPGVGMSVGSGGGGGGGNGWTTISASPVSISKPKTIFLSSDGKEVSVDEIVDFMDIMKRRMLILTPDFEKHEKFPALKEAYEQYLVLDKLMREDHTPDE